MERGWRQYRRFEKGEFVVVGYDLAMGGPDYSAAIFLSKTHLDVPLVFHRRCIATDATNAIVPVLERVSDETGVRPVIAPETNAGGVFEINRINAMNRLGKFKVYEDRLQRATLEYTDAKKYGWTTNSATRPKMLEDLKSAIDNQLIRVYDKQTINEMFSFVVVQTTSAWKAQAERNSHDDLLMALAVAWQVQQVEAGFEQNYSGEAPPDDTNLFRGGWY